MQSDSSKNIYHPSCSECVDNSAEEVSSYLSFLLLESLLYQMTNIYNSINAAIGNFYICIAGVCIQYLFLLFNIFTHYFWL